MITKQLARKGTRQTQIIETVLEPGLIACGLGAGEGVEKMARAVSKAFLQGLAWTLAYYVHGNIPLLLPGDPH